MLTITTIITAIQIKGTVMISVGLFFLGVEGLPVAACAHATHGSIASDVSAHPDRLLGPEQSADVKDAQQSAATFLHLICNALTNSFRPQPRTLS